LGERFQTLAPYLRLIRNFRQMVRFGGGAPGSWHSRMRMGASRTFTRALTTTAGRRRAFSHRRERDLVRAQTTAALVLGLASASHCSTDWPKGALPEGARELVGGERLDEAHHGTSWRHACRHLVHDERDRSRAETEDDEFSRHLKKRHDAPGGER